MLLIATGGINGKSKVVTSCRHLEESFQDWAEKGVVMTTSVESLGVDSGTRTKQLGAKEKTRRKKCEVIPAHQQKFHLREVTWELGVRKLLRTGLVPARV